MNKEKKYLPIGTVCLLKNGKKRIMITGYSTVSNKGEKKEIYDYIGCLYPEGTLSSGKSFLFNHVDIEKIYYMGYQDEKSKEFCNLLKSFVSKVQNGEIDLDKIDN